MAWYPADNKDVGFYGMVMLAFCGKDGASSRAVPFSSSIFARHGSRFASPGCYLTPVKEEEEERVVVVARTSVSGVVAHS